MAELNMACRCWQTLRFRHADPAVISDDSSVMVEKCDYMPVPLSPGSFVGTAGSAEECQRSNVAQVLFFPLPGIGPSSTVWEPRTRYRRDGMG